jgi:hypothetical protein
MANGNILRRSIPTDRKVPIPAALREESVQAIGEWRIDRRDGNLQNINLWDLPRIPEG